MQQAVGEAVARGVVRFLTTSDPGSGFISPPRLADDNRAGGGTENCQDPPLWPELGWRACLPRLAVPSDRPPPPSPSSGSGSTTACGSCCMPDSSAPTVAIAVVYDVGFRSEPEGMTGFAHLFEHLMFEGSVTLEKGQHDKLVTGNGGVMNGSTRADYTNYYEQLPSNALELGLYLEADRMRGLRLTDENVPEPDRRREGGDPGQRRQPALRRVPLDPAAAGDVQDLRQRPQRLRQLRRPRGGHRRPGGGRSSTGTTPPATPPWWWPATSTSTRRGRWSSATSAPSRPGPSRRSGRSPSRCPPRSAGACTTTRWRRSARWPSPTGCPTPSTSSRTTWPRPSSPTCWRTGTASRLYQRLVKRDQLATHVGGMLGTFGDPFDMRDPTMLQLLAYHPGGDIEPLLDALDEEAGGRRWPAAPPRRRSTGS